MICGVRMMSGSESGNYEILKQLMSKLRRIDVSTPLDYIILYTFSYKYVSDFVKDSVSLQLKNEDITMDEAYRDVDNIDNLRSYSLKNYGFFINSSESFIEEVVGNSYPQSDFLEDYLKKFPREAVFSQQHYNLNYFDEFFKAVDDEVNVSEFDEELIHDIWEIIYLISRLDIFDGEFAFGDVFNIISASRLNHRDSDPEFIIQILSHIVNSNKMSINNVYDPFLKNGDSLLAITEFGEGNLINYYGKEKNRLNYFYSMVKYFINHLPLNKLFLKNEDAFDSIDIDGASFDVILSRIPISIKNYHSSNLNQSNEIVRRNKRSEIENLLADNLGMDGESFKENNNLNEALQNLLEQIDLKDFNVDFTEEYQSLQDSEFLFLINLIDSLTSDGVMAISISENFLFKNSLDLLRKYLAFEKNYIEAIIRIPTEIIRSKPEVVIVFRKNKLNTDILFIDMTSDYSTQKSHLAYPGLFRRNLILDDESINKMADTYVNKLTVPKYSNLVSADEIIKNNFNLSVSRYVDTFEGEFISLEEVFREKQEIESNISELNFKIKKMMDELDIHFKE